MNSKPVILAVSGSVNRDYCFGPVHLRSITERKASRQSLIFRSSCNKSHRNVGGREQLSAPSLGKIVSRRLAIFPYRINAGNLLTLNLYFRAIMTNRRQLLVVLSTLLLVNASVAPTLGTSLSSSTAANLGELTSPTKENETRSALDLKRAAIEKLNETELRGAKSGKKKDGKNGGHENGGGKTNRGNDHKDSPTVTRASSNSNSRDSTSRSRTSSTGTAFPRSRSLPSTERSLLRLHNGHRTFLN